MRTCTALLILARGVAYPFRLAISTIIYIHEEDNVTAQPLQTLSYAKHETVEDVMTRVSLI